MIAPVVEELAKSEAKPGLAFAKVDTDHQQEIARRYSISA